MSNLGRLAPSDRAAPDDPGSIAVVLGTRPDIVKLAPVVRELGERARTIDTGQHYDRQLSRVFFDAFGLGQPDVSLEIGGQSRGRQIGASTGDLDAHFAEAPPAAVVVQGDTNTCVGAALAANARNLPLVHIEAGLRSFDRAMPEEHNRVVTDHLSDLCCAPTRTNVENLAAERIEGDRVSMTGNTVVEAVEHLAPAEKERRQSLDRYGLTRTGFVLATFHRPENVDDPVQLKRILSELAEVELPVLLPLHPRTAANIDEFGMKEMCEPLIVTEPLGYQEFLGLAAESALILSDSGGIQEEASVLKRPVGVVRRSTERPEVIGTFAELLPPGAPVAEWANGRLAEIDTIHERLAGLPSPYGDGTAARQSVAAIDRLLGIAV